MSEAPRQEETKAVLSYAEGDDIASGVVQQMVGKSLDLTRA